ncbi:hypothetical protein J437_LFUL008441 [Ladona fulva]|uniref:Uncharacterized protein n=1 Tax=Ladona fulva TaxID=123851 RepID=A0A8K0NZC1_LADFU|nr:hypothetical protein J437_LFUL008441 [Ladona fulva]
MMSLNISKCQVISFHKNQSPIKFDYTIDNNVLKRVFFDTSLSFQAHIHSITVKASKTLKFVYRVTKDFDNANIMKYLYCSLIRPILEYCFIVWSLYYNVHKQTVERVQNRFLRIISYKSHLNSNNSTISLDINLPPFYYYSIYYIIV